MKHKIKKSFKVEIFPDTEMEQIFMQHIGTTRFLYNHLLTMCNDKYKQGQKKLNKTEMQAEIAKLKKEEEYKWLNDICSTTCQSAAHKLDQAYDNFFNKNMKNKAPRYKTKKKSRKSFILTSNHKETKGTIRFEVIIV